MIEISILDQGCGCQHCSQMTLDGLEQARNEWKNGKREIVFEYWSYECSDRCCSEYGTSMKINGFEVSRSGGDSVEHVTEVLMEFLEFDNVNIEYEYDEDE